jgi:nucleotide-binding universal stress UspA family protein
MSSMPFKSLLVPVDTNAENQRVVEIAAQLASLDTGAMMVLLHVIETIEDTPENEVRDFYAELEQQARASMEALVDGMTSKPATIERRIAYGHRAAEILDAAAECRADLIVMRSHRVEPGRPGGGLGTLSHEVALLAAVPVLLVK